MHITVCSKDFAVEPINLCKECVIYVLWLLLSLARNRDIERLYSLSLMNLWSMFSDCFYLWWETEAQEGYIACPRCLSSGVGTRHTPVCCAPFSHSPLNPALTKSFLPYFLSQVFLFLLLLSSCKCHTNSRNYRYDLVIEFLNVFQHGLCNVFSHFLLVPW